MATWHYAGYRLAPTMAQPLTLAYFTSNDILPTETFENTTLPAIKLYRRRDAVDSESGPRLSQTLVHAGTPSLLRMRKRQ